MAISGVIRLPSQTTARNTHKKENKMETIKRSSSCYRPWTAAGKEISRVHIHDGEKVLYTTHSGWLEHAYRVTEVYGGTQDVTSVLVDKVRNARKVDLSKKDTFIASFSDNESGYRKSGKALYIYAPDCRFWQTVESRGDNEIRYCDLYKVKLDCTINQHRLKEDGDGIEYFEEATNEIIVKCNHRTEPTERGKELRELTDSINEHLYRDRTLSVSDIEKLLETFEITRRAK